MSLTDFDLSEVQAARNRRRRRRYRINLSRHVYNEREFTESFIKREDYVSSSEIDNSSFAKSFKRHFFPTRCTCKDALRSWFPIVEWLPTYNLRQDMAHDLAGGLTVAIMHIPQGMASTCCLNVACEGNSLGKWREFVIFCFSLTYSNHGTGPGVERMSGAERGRERGGGGGICMAEVLLAWTCKN